MSQKERLISLLSNVFVAQEKNFKRKSPLQTISMFNQWERI